jgi:hypothetical protein
MSTRQRRRNEEQELEELDGRYPLAVGVQELQHQRMNYAETPWMATNAWQSDVSSYEENESTSTGGDATSLLQQQDNDQRDSTSRTWFGRPSREERRVRRRMPEGWTFLLIRWPLLAFIFCIVAIELCFYVIVRAFVTLHERWLVWRGRKLEMRRRLEQAQSYEEWKHHALALDAHMKKQAWKMHPVSAYYDHRLIQRVEFDLFCDEREREKA